MHRRPENFVQRYGYFECSNCKREWKSAKVYCHKYTNEVWRGMKCYGCFIDKLCKPYRIRCIDLDRKERRNPSRIFPMAPKPYHPEPPEECPGCGRGLGHCVCTEELERYVNMTSSYGRKLSQITPKAGQQWDDVRGGDEGCDVDDDEDDHDQGDDDTDDRGEFHRVEHKRRRGHRFKGTYDVKPPVKLTTQTQRKLPEMPSAVYTMVDVSKDNSDDDEFNYDTYNLRKSHRSKGSYHYDDDDFGRLV